MSVILRQGLKYSIVGYLGFLLGTLANFFIFPNDLEFYGKLRFIFPTAEMFVPIVIFLMSSFLHRPKKMENTRICSRCPL